MPSPGDGSAIDVLLDQFEMLIRSPGELVSCRTPPFNSGGRNAPFGGVKGSRLGDGNLSKDVLNKG